MNRITVTSSNVDSVGYDLNTQTLEVGFKNGYVYQYFDVPEPIYQQMINTDSAGKFLINNIKGVLYTAFLEDWSVPLTVTMERLGYDNKRHKYKVTTLWLEDTYKEAGKTKKEGLEALKTAERAVFWD